VSYTYHWCRSCLGSGCNFCHGTGLNLEDADALEIIKATAFYERRRTLQEIRAQSGDSAERSRRIPRGGRGKEVWGGWDQSVQEEKEAAEEAVKRIIGAEMETVKDELSIKFAYRKGGWYYETPDFRSEKFNSFMDAAHSFDRGHIRHQVSSQPFEPYATTATIADKIIGDE